MDKVKKTWDENEAPILRWILTIILSISTGGLLGAFLNKAVGRLPFLQDGHFLGPERDLLSGIASFAAIYLSFWFFLRVLCKTSLRAFFFGKGRKADKAAMLVSGLLYLAGLFIAQLLRPGNIKYDHQSISIVLVNALLCLCFLWLQTTVEEIYFRGLFMRIPYKNNVPALPKGLIVAAISSLLFMSGHLANPEVTSRSGLTLILMASSYFLTGFMMFLSNLLVGGMEPGMAIHFVNNFFCFVFIRAEVTALMTPAMFVDYTQSDVAVLELLTLLIAYTPVMIYLIVRYRKRRIPEA